MGGGMGVRRVAGCVVSCLLRYLPSLFRSSPVIQPLARYITVSLIPESQPSSFILTPPQDNPMRWAVIEAIGPLVRDLQVKQEALVSTHQGTYFGDTLLLPSESVLATR